MPCSEELGKIVRIPVSFRGHAAQRVDGGLDNGWSFALQKHRHKIRILPLCCNCQNNELGIYAFPTTLFLDSSAYLLLIVFIQVCLLLRVATATKLQRMVGDIHAPKEVLRRTPFGVDSDLHILLLRFESFPSTPKSTVEALTIFHQVVVRDHPNSSVLLLNGVQDLCKTALGDVSGVLTYLQCDLILRTLEHAQETNKDPFVTCDLLICCH
mmetsp:Transcript_56091/g.105671  ORF Transcript_56091/g.105671 Transcript_56091/m.105671 type:complete len:212 (+) Transcript_56091:517-1152(+)